MTEELRWWNEVKIAKVIAQMAHFNQTRRDGKPYFSHVEAVASQVLPKYRALAYLHDTIEDVPWVNYGMLAAAGISAETLKGIQILTRFRQQPYHEYIETIAKSKHIPSLVVKVADLRHNLSDDAAQYGLDDRYNQALTILQLTLEEVQREGQTV